VVSVISPHLLACDAAWDDGPDAGAWIADRLGPFGPSVGHAVPLGYEAYAIVPIPLDACEDDPVDWILVTLIDLLDRSNRAQSVHFGIWEGWGSMYDTGTDPRYADGSSAGVGWLGDDPPTQDEIDRALAESRERMAATRIERPDADPLELPNSRYYLWTGPPRSATAFEHDAPSLIWPDDRSWFVGVPIYTNEIAVAAATDLIDTILADPRFGAREATPDDVLDIDD